MRWFLIFFTSALFAQSAVTYQLSGGRFGDNLIAYLHGKWIAYKNDLPFLYVPFNYSSKLILSEKEILYEGSQSFQLTTRVERDFHILPSSLSTLYIVPYFPEDPHELRAGRSDLGLPYGYFYPNWKDPTFRKAVREMIAPRYPVKTLDLPSERVTIAIHIRHGGRFDPTTHGRYYPLKFPALPFYIDGLAKLLELFKTKPVYCYLFTDALDRPALAAQFKDVLSKHPNAILDYRDPQTDYEDLVLEDFFSLLKFDAIIRPYSNFSVAATLINDYAVIYSPKTFVHRGTNSIIREVDLIVNEELYKKAMEK
ncbi:MAG TPA: hypothetical protein VLE89_01105 [Chlamydiales bacterium]|nr:hypothetical protein [Chlamydiales bacterium]